MTSRSPFEKVSSNEGRAQFLGKSLETVFGGGHEDHSITLQTQKLGLMSSQKLPGGWLSTLVVQLCIVEKVARKAPVDATASIGGPVGVFVFGPFGPFGSLQTDKTYVVLINQGHQHMTCACQHRQH